MTTRDYLNQLRTIDLEIAMSRSEEVSWLELATKIHHEPSEVMVSTSHAPDKMESIVVKAADCAIKADREREILIYLKATIENQIKKMENMDEKYMLWGYYHDKASVYDLSKTLSVSYRQGKRIIKRATEEFEDKWGHTYL